MKKDELEIVMKYKGKTIKKSIDSLLSESIISGRGTQPIIKATIQMLRDLRQKL